MRLSRMLTSLLAAALLASPVLLAQSDPLGDLRFLDAQFRAGSYLGVALSDIDADRAKTLRMGDPRGAEITRVEVGSPASQAGLKAGDVLLSYNGENILGAEHLGRLVSETPVGRRIKIEYWRNGRTESTVVTTASHQRSTVRLMPLMNMDNPDTRLWITPDTPAPLMVWKNLMLGVVCEPLDAQLAQYFGVKDGILIRSVERDSAGEKAGIRAGDVLIAINSVPLTGPRDLSSYMRTQRETRSAVSVKLVRDRKEISLSVPVSRNPE